MAVPSLTSLASLTLSLSTDAPIARELCSIFSVDDSPIIQRSSLLVHPRAHREKTTASSDLQPNRPRESGPKGYQGWKDFSPLAFELEQCSFFQASRSGVHKIS
jgi:hypothetical protein